MPSPARSHGGATSAYVSFPSPSDGSCDRPALIGGTLEPGVDVPVAHEVVILVLDVLVAVRARLGPALPSGLVACIPRLAERDVLLLGVGLRLQQTDELLVGHVRHLRPRLSLLPLLVTLLAIGGEFHHLGLRSAEGRCHGSEP